MFFLVPRCAATAEIHRVLCAVAPTILVSVRTNDHAKITSVPHLLGRKATIIYNIQLIDDISVVEFLLWSTCHSFLKLENCVGDLFHFITTMGTELHRMTIVPFEYTVMVLYSHETVRSSKWNVALDFGGGFATVFSAPKAGKIARKHVRANNNPKRIRVRVATDHLLYPTIGLLVD